MGRAVRKGKPFQHVAALGKRASSDGTDALIWARSGGKGPPDRVERTSEPRKPLQDASGRGADRRKGGGKIFQRGGARFLLQLLMEVPRNLEFYSLSA